MSDLCTLSKAGPPRPALLVFGASLTLEGGWHLALEPIAPGERLTTEQGATFEALEPIEAYSLQRYAAPVRAC